MRSRTLPAEDVRRARLILLLAEGKPYSAIRQVLGCNPNYISRWKGHFEAERLAGLYSHYRGRAVEKRTPALEAKILVRLNFDLCRADKIRMSAPRAPARFRAFPDNTGIALKGDKPVACVGPILKLLDGHVIAGLAAGTAGEECPRDIDHVRRTLALVKQRRPAPAAEASCRLCFRILEASDASLAPQHAGMLAPTADIGRIRGAVRATAGCGVIVPGPKSGKVDLYLHGTAKAAAKHVPTRWV